MVKPALTNTLAARLAVVESYMTRTVEGQSALLINQSETELIKALAGKYRYKINTKGVQDDAPEKSHPWSDYADGLQYACLQHDGGAAYGMAVTTARREIKPAPLAWARC